MSKETPPIDPKVVEVDDVYKLYAKAEVTGLIAERICCPGAKINGAKLMELRRANVSNADALASELKLKRVSIEVRGREGLCRTMVQLVEKSVRRKAYTTRG